MKSKNIPGKFHLTKEEKAKIAEKTPPSSEVKDKTKKVISKHLNSIKKLAGK